MNPLDLNFRRGLTWLIWLVNLFVAPVMIYAEWSDYQDHARHAEEKAENVAQVMERSLSGIFDQINLLLVSVQNELEGELVKGKVDTQEVNVTIRRFASNVPGLKVVSYSDAQGQVARNTGYPMGNPAINIRDRDYFQQLREHADAGLVSSKPVVGKISGKWVIVFARSYRYPDGKFAGVVYASIAVERFPLPEAEALAEPDAVGQIIGLEAGQTGLRILVVDDTATNRELVKLLLEEVGFEVRTARDGQQAVEIFQSWQPCFIWMDMRMPVMDGYQATRQIRSLPGGDAVKIVALTASSFDEDRKMIMDAGCDDMLIKPFDEKRLFAIMPTPWKILIADDDHDVHAATRMALRGVSFRGRTLEFIDAYSGTETLEVLEKNPDTAILFLDVIMETDDAGLRTAQRIRELNYHLVRIIIRTGFPGQAPERNVIVEYDIHDYKEKTGLSVQKLFTTVISALRAYDDLVALENHQRGLMSVLESVSWFDFNAVQRYVCGMLSAFVDIARLDAEYVVMVTRPSANSNAEPVVVAALGEYQGSGESDLNAGLPQEVAEIAHDSLNKMQALTGACGSTLFSSSHGVDLVVFAAGDNAFSRADEVLLEVFLIKVCQAISNQRTFADMASDRDVVLRGLAMRGERWDDGAAAGLSRLSRLASAMAARLDAMLVFPGIVIDDLFLRDIGIAATLHDLGNEVLPVALLTRNIAYSADERTLMQTHVLEGVKLLEGFTAGGSHPGALNLARNIVAGHHECFDGSGYPAGLRGEAIPLSARLVAVADAYVAMTSPRPHRPAMASSTACAAIKAGENIQFDPRMVQTLLELLDGDLEY